MALRGVVPFSICVANSSFASNTDSATIWPGGRVTGESGKTHLLAMHNLKFKRPQGTCGGYLPIFHQLIPSTVSCHHTFIMMRRSKIQASNLLIKRLFSPHITLPFPNPPHPHTPTLIAFISSQLSLTSQTVNGHPPMCFKSPPSPSPEPIRMSRRYLNNQGNTHSPRLISH